MNGANSYLKSRSKRLIDVIGGTIGLVIGLPFIILSCLIVLLIDRVPPVFIQERLGLENKSFPFLKLRTLKVIEKSDMVNNNVLNHKQPYQTTTTGRFWRATSIDELLQFWLVLNGEMSLIGYRPFPIHHISHLHLLPGLNESVVNEYLNAIKNVKPGMSALSVVNGRTDLSIAKKIEYDLEYVRSASFKGDLVLLAKTFLTVFRLRG